MLGVILNDIGVMLGLYLSNTLSVLYNYSYVWLSNVGTIGRGPLPVSEGF